MAAVKVKVVDTHQQGKRGPSERTVTPNVVFREVLYVAYILRDL